MVTSRRSLIAGLVGASFSIWLRSARSQTFVALQYHPQPVGSHLHVYLTKLWDAVRNETRGQLDVAVYPQNNGATIADPELLKQLQSGALDMGFIQAAELGSRVPHIAAINAPYIVRSTPARRAGAPCSPDRARCGMYALTCRR